MSGRILIVESAASSRALLKAKLTAAYYDVVSAAQASEAQAAVRSYAPDLVIVDAEAGAPDGYALCMVLQSEERLYGVPVVMTLPAGDAGAPLKAMGAGADDFLCKPYSDAALFARIKNLLSIKTMADELDLRQRGMELGLQAETGLTPPQGRVLIVADDAEDAAAWSGHLSPWVAGVSAMTGGVRDALLRANAEQPDVCLVCDRLSDGSDGFRLISALRAQPDGREMAILCALEDEARAQVEAVYHVGATDYVARPFDGNELVARVQSLVRRKLKAQKLRAGLIDRLRQAMMDPLTEVANRRHAVRKLNQLLSSDDGAARFGVVMLDIDRFKSVNDRYGHAVGDAVLKEFARRVSVLASEADTVARMGGEEFLVLIPGADRTQAAAMAERIRAAIEETPFSVTGAGQIPVTVSIGVSTGRGTESGPASVLEQADRALYASKSAGRNRVTVFSDAA